MRATASRHAWDTPGLSRCLPLSASARHRRIPRVKGEALCTWLPYMQLLHRNALAVVGLVVPETDRRTETPSQEEGDRR
jgi:hypothetical protein